MDNFKYYLTFDFNIIYVPENYAILGYKKLNFENLKFENHKCDGSVVKYSYPILENRLQYIINGILLGKVSYILDNKSTNWLKEFEENLKDNKDLMNNVSYIFNYLALKLMLAGFSKKEALSISNLYIDYKTKNKPSIPSVKTVIDELDRIIDRKKYWIINDIEKYEYMEIKFLDNILSDFEEDITTFNLKKYDSEYLLMCQGSFSKMNYKLNTNKSYLVKEILPFDEQKKYILYYYDFIMKHLIDTLINNSYNHVKGINNIKSTILNHLKSILIMSIDTWK